MRQSTLEDANEIINGERAKDYGSALENIGRTAKLWSAVLGQEVTIEQVCLCLVQLKVARLVNTPKHRDSWMDIAGYVGVWDKSEAGE